MEQLMTIKQAAERWQVNEEVLRRNCAQGIVIAYKIGTLWRIPREENERANK